MAITTAKGTIIKIGDGASPEDFSAIGEVRSIDGPSASAVVQDITTHSTSGNWMNKLATLLDPGNVSFAINFDSVDATHAFATGMWADFIALTKRNLQEIFPNSAGQLDFSGYFIGHPFVAPVDNVLQANIELALTGAIEAT